MKKLFIDKRQTSSDYAFLQFILHISHIFVDRKL